MLNNLQLRGACRDKKDEFYTQLEDIEEELVHYKEQFKNKIVYCNCDDPRYSKFVDYFICNFDYLGLKRLIATCYKPNNADLFNHRRGGHGISLVYEGGNLGDRIPKIEQIGMGHLRGDGDFRSSECMKLLNQADIVVTNPPFSLFRPYIMQLVRQGKKFLILGNVNAITYKSVYTLIKEGKLWLGATKRNMWFRVPEEYPIIASKSRTDNMGYNYISLSGIRWYTNLNHNKKPPPLSLFKKYKPADYPKYDNCDAIEVSKIKEIPMDYGGLMGVPITFMDKYNSKQFEIVRFRTGDDGKNLLLDGRETYLRILIKHKKS